MPGELAAAREKFVVSYLNRLDQELGILEESLGMLESSLAPVLSVDFPDPPILSRINKEKLLVETEDSVPLPQLADTLRLFVVRITKIYGGIKSINRRIEI